MLLIFIGCRSSLFLLFPLISGSLSLEFWLLFFVLGYLLLVFSHPCNMTPVWRWISYVGYKPCIFCRGCLCQSCIWWRIIGAVITLQNGKHNNSGLPETGARVVLPPAVSGAHECTGSCRSYSSPRPRSSCTGITSVRPISCWLWLLAGSTCWQLLLDLLSLLVCISWLWLFAQFKYTYLLTYLVHSVVVSPMWAGAIPAYPVTSPLPHLSLYPLVSFPFFLFLFMLHLSSCFSYLPILPE